MTAQQLIRASVATTSIQFGEYSSDLHADLLISADDMVESEGTMEYWGQTDDGYEWRIHLTGRQSEGS